MFKNMKIGVRLYGGFIIVQLMMCALGLIAVNSVNKASDTAADMYNHPFAISNAALAAKAEIVAIEGTMKDITIAFMPGAIETAEKQINANEAAALKQFDIIDERFIGDKTLVDAARKAIVGYKPIRDQFIALSKQGKRPEASQLNASEGKKQRELINKTMNALVEDARKNADGYMQNAAATGKSVVTQTISMLIGAVIIGSAIAYIIGAGITGPMGHLSDRMRALTEGNHQSPIPGTDRRDEVGGMAKMVEVFRKNAEEKVRLEKAQEENAVKAEQEKKAMMMKMADDFEQSVGHAIEVVSTAAGDLESSAHNMRLTADQATSQANTVASASEMASQNVQTVASAAEELAASQNEISSHINRASSVSNGAVEQLGSTQRTVSEMVGEVEKISEVVNLISDIAEQTNLLALNATIEAARAGDAGKGFAVVASEVKNLANQTARATEEITNQIGSVQTVTHQAAEAINEIEKTIAQIDEIANSVAAAVEEQTSATREIAQNADMAASGTNEVANNIAGVTQAANETGSAATNILDAAQALTAESDKLKKGVDDFVAQIRA